MYEPCRQCNICRLISQAGSGTVYWPCWRHLKLLFPVAGAGPSLDRPCPSSSKVSPGKLLELQALPRLFQMSQHVAQRLDIVLCPRTRASMEPQGHPLAVDRLDRQHLEAIVV